MSSSKSFRNVERVTYNYCIIIKNRILLYVILCINKAAEENNTLNDMNMNVPGDTKELHIYTLILSMGLGYIVEKKCS